METLNNIKILLKNRVGFRKPIDGSFEALDADNLLSDSGLIFQDEHPMVSISLIGDSQPTDDITDEQLNTYLKNLRESNVLSVLNDVFKGQSGIDEDLINSDLSVFDKAISYRMVLKVGEMITASSRSNISARLGEDTINKFRLDLQGSTNPNFPYHLGYTTRYREEIEVLKTMFNDSYGKMLDITTLG